MPHFIPYMYTFSYLEQRNVDFFFLQLSFQRKKNIHVKYEKVNKFLR